MKTYKYKKKHWNININEQLQHT